jgi:ATP phosphoribosyltransferase
LERSGLHVVDGADRKLYAETVDPDVTLLFARAADIPKYVSDGAADVGITGHDQIEESGPENVTELLDLGFGQCRLVLASPEEGDIKSVDQLDGKKVATEFPTIARNYFDAQGVDPHIVEVTGATELTPHVEMADAIIDITSTGTTLKVNRLGIIDEVLDSSVRLFARDDVLDDDKVGQIETAMASVLSADGKRYLVVHGDGFDRVSTNHRWLAGLGAIGYDSLLVVNRFYNRYRAWRGKEYFSLSRSVKARVKSAVSFVDNYEHQLQEFARRRKCDGIICGHIHTPEDKRVGGIRYLNSGDWVESLTAVVEHRDGLRRGGVLGQ